MVGTEKDEKKEQLLAKEEGGEDKPDENRDPCGCLNFFDKHSRGCTKPFTRVVDTCPTKWGKCLMCFVWISIPWFIFRGIIQFIMFHWAVMGCSASALENNHYSGGGWTCPPGFNIPDNFNAWPAAVANYSEHNEDACKYTPADNAVPSMALIKEGDHTFMGRQYIVYPTVSGSGTIDQGQVGTWWRTWGPWFWTYTYQELDGKQTIYMRPTLMGMLGLYSETRIMRCDGGGDVWFFGEGSGWVSNRIRSTFGALFGMQREATFYIYQNGDLFGSALETFHGSQKSITFRTGGQNSDRLGSAVLAAPQGQPPKDLWSLHTQEHVNYHQLPPAFVMEAATLLMAFRWMTIRHERGILSGHQHPPADGGGSSSPPNFLAETSNASSAFFEETIDESANTDSSDAEGQKV